ncbi:MAG TPA: hypothetical protein VGT40_05230 [Methylomirabilota bacterium]|jgi:hypothetical protein|nr:hypothetical protein [Methylomirabilota bacterium]
MIRSIALSAAAAMVIFVSVAEPVQSASRVKDARQGSESVIQGAVAWANREGTELVLDNGTHLTVPLSVKNVVHTDLKHGRPIKAWYEKRDGQNVVTAMFVSAITPGGGG